MEEVLKSIALENTNCRPYRILKLRRGLQANKGFKIQDCQRHRVLVDTIQTITMVVVYIYCQISKIKGLIK